MKMANDYPARFPICLPAGIAALLCALLVSFPACAENLEAKLRSGMIAKAGFHPGLPTLPAVLMLHGFLQTGHSPPTSTLAANLSSRGYTVLSPTISLGTNRRSQSMACEAAHTHSMEDEVAEVAYWINWLSKKGYAEIVLAGFSSSGSNAALVYASRHAHPAVKKTILINPNPIYTDHRERQKTATIANGKSLSKFSMGYCKRNFTATIGSYLSYAGYDENKMLELLKNTPIQTEIILGSADNLLPANWAGRIRALQSRANVSIIENANHFFDGMQEFDLAGEVENILKNTQVSKS